jgi:GDP-L-fucose synthase
MKVLVTGSESMIGKQVVKKLIDERFCIEEFPHDDSHDLLDSYSTDKIFIEASPDYVIHLAGKNGGIDMNSKIPAEIFYKTVTMGLNVINASVKAGVKKIIFIVPSCALNPDAVEASENDLYEGRPHISVECHGLAKRAVEAYGRQVEKQYGIKFVTCIANNSFGPFDNFSSGGKVISGMIKKFYEAKKNNEPSLTLWGTGKPLREFIYCKDIAEGLIQVMKIYNIYSPINLTSDYEISIKDLAYKIKDIIGYNGVIIFDTAKQDGQMRKKMNSDKMKKYLDFAITDFDVALKETIDWYISTLENK